MKKLFGLTLIFLAHCGGGSVPSDHPPSVAGSYSCISGCMGACEFTTLSVTQSASHVIAVTPVSTCSGDINNDGNYSANCNGGSVDTNGSCEGTFAGGVFTADCSFGGVTCQRAAFQKN